MLAPIVAPLPDYDAGARLIERLRAVPVGGTVSPTWLDGGRRLAFKEDDGFALVDARTGARTHVAKIAGIANASLPAVLPPPNSGGGEETEITLRNTSRAKVDVFWVDGEGNRRKFHTLAPGESVIQHTFAGHTWLFTDSDGKPLAAYVAIAGSGTANWDGTPPPPEPVRSPPGLSPDGTMQAFARQGRLYLRKGGKETPLSKDGTSADGYRGALWWSPDGKRIAALRTEAGGNRRLVIRREGKPTIDEKYLKPGDKIDHDRLVLFDVATGSERRADEAPAPNPWDLTEVHWSDDSREVFYVYNQRGHQILRLLAADAATGRVRTVVEERSRTFLDYSSKLYVRYLSNGQALWTSERSGYNGLYLVDLAKATLKPVAKGDWVVRSVEDVDEANRTATLRVMGLNPKEDPYHMHFIRIGLDGRNLTRLTEGDGTHRLIPAPDGESYVDMYSRVDRPPVSELRAKDGRLLATLATGSDAKLEEAGWHAPERFAAKGRDGKTDVWGLIYRPSNFDPAKRYPVIEDIYAGPQDFFVPKSFSPTWGDMRLTELGFVVVRIDGMGTNWRSRAFHDVAFKNLADAGFPDRIRWMNAARKTRPWMDLTRVGVYGTSAGGQSAASAVLRFGDVYKAAVADCGCHDNRLDKIWWNEQWMGWPVDASYAENSNENPKYVKTLKAPIYLMVGEVDTNVDPVSTFVVADALKAANKPYELMIVPDAGHGVLGRPAPYRAMQEFFVEHLKP